MILMKHSFKFIALFMLGILVFSNCKKKDDPVDPVPPVKSTSLIVAGSRVGHYVIVDPNTGIDKVEVTPAVQTVVRVALGFLSQKALIISPPGPGTGVNVIYTADRETGANLFKLTSENDWNVVDIEGSPIAARVAYAGYDIANNHLNIHAINENGTGYEQLTFFEEGIECPDKAVSTKLIGASFPAWSPNGTKIAFMGYLREIITNYPHNAILIMDSDGGNKQVLYQKPVEETWFRDISWTKDAQFLIFSESDGKRFVKALNVSSGTITDITASLEIGGTEVENLWTSPDSDKIVYNVNVPGGGNLYTASYLEMGDVMMIQGVGIQLTQDNVGHGYAQPDWQLWNGVK